MFKDLLKETKEVNEGTFTLRDGSDLWEFVTSLIMHTNDIKLGQFWSDHHAYWSKEVVMDYDGEKRVVTLTAGKDKVSFVVPRVKVL